MNDMYGMYCGGWEMSMGDMESYHHVMSMRCKQVLC